MVTKTYEALKEYQAAQDRVIFAGDWEFEESDLEACFNGYLKCGKNIWFIQVKDDVMWFEVGEVDTPIYRIEDLPREINFKEGVI